jgi:hypothetical protein
MATLNRTFSVKNGIDVANTIIVDSNRNVSNVANLSANTGTFSGNVNVSGTLITQNIIPAANVTFNLGSPTARFKDLYLSGSTLDLNGVQLSATGDEFQANTFNASVSFVSAGLNVLDQANTARGQANTARDQANTARDQANTARDQANTARDQANAAYVQANAASSSSNSSANTVRVSANGGSTLSGKQLNFVNTSTAVITVSDAADGNANITVNVIGGGAIALAYDQANTARDTANAAYDQANAAYGAANQKLNLTGGTINGDLTVDGNLFVNGVQTVVNTNSLTINDPIFLLANNNTTNSVGIGIVGHYGPTQQHTGLVRAHQDNIWYLFQDYDEHILYANNVLDTGNIKLATLKANVVANSLLLVDQVVATQANLTLAHNQANTARNQANTARDQANDAFGQANSARDQANTARDQANAAYDAANTRVLKSGDTMTGALTITTSGIGLSVSNANVRFSLQVNSLNVTTNTVTTSSSGQVVLDKFPIAQLASAKYFVQANSASDYQTTEIVLVQDATNVWLTEYGSIQTGPSLGTFTADISGGDVRLLFTAVNNINTIRSVRYGIIP